MRRIRTYHEVDDGGTAEVLEQVVAQRDRLGRRLAGVRRTVAVASGKGGVGKSMVTANLAAALADRGRRVGAVDADLNGPSLARMLGAGGRLVAGADGIEPARGAAGVRVISMDLLLADDDSPLRWREPERGGFIWRSPLETGALREFLADVEWGELDFLVVDVPPGTDRMERLLDLLPAPSLLLLVTTPSEAARAAVARSARLAREAGAPKLALVGNMTGFHCAACGAESPLYDDDGARRLADAAGLPLWAEIPFDPRLASATDAGRPYVLDAGDAPAAAALRGLADRVERETGGETGTPTGRAG